MPITPAFALAHPFFQVVKKALKALYVRDGRPRKVRITNAIDKGLHPAVTVGGDARGFTFYRDGDTLLFEARPLAALWDMREDRYINKAEHDELIAGFDTALQELLEGYLLEPDFGVSYDGWEIKCDVIE